MEDSILHSVSVTDSKERSGHKLCGLIQHKAAFLFIFAEDRVHLRPVRAIKCKYNMKKILLTIILAATAASAFAQPRSCGLRIGASGFEADYLHTFINKNQFLEGNFGVDFGYNAKGNPGVKATATYNFVWARPAWTEKGSWALYAGPGVSIGYVNDQDHIMVDTTVKPYYANGFMLGVCAQVGLEYTFWFPLQLAIDLRPVFGIHVNGGYSSIDTANPEVASRTPVETGFYDNGLLGFVPTISARYRF